MMVWTSNTQEKEEQSCRGRGGVGHPRCAPSRGSQAGNNWLVV